MSTLHFKVLKPHIKDCSALANAKRGVWSTSWAFLKQLEYRDAAGRLRKDMAGQRWWRIGCNHIGCEAEIAVSETSILEALPHE